MKSRRIDGIIMMTIKKIYAWCKHHWRWLLLVLIAFTAYLLGRKNSRGLFEQAKLAKDQYKKEAEMIEKSYKEKDKKIKKAEKENQEENFKAEKKKSISIQALDKEKREEIEKHLDDPEKLDKALKELGIKEV